MDRLEAAILGPHSSPYQGGIFRLSIAIPDRYLLVLVVLTQAPPVEAL